MINQKFITHPLTRPALRPSTGGQYLLRHVKGIVMHWTGNTKQGADAMANRNYFGNGSPGAGGTFRAASAHYCVDDKNIVQVIPTNEVAFHCGDTPQGKYKKAGREMITEKGLTPNYYTIGIEMCVNSDGDWNKTYQRSAALAARELVRFGLPLEGGLFRHYDITGKKCPAMMIQESEWMKFKTAVAAEIEALQPLILFYAVLHTAKSNLRPFPNMKNAPIGTLYQGEPVIVVGTEGNWCNVWPSGWVYKDLLTK